MENLQKDKQGKISVETSTNTENVITLVLELKERLSNIVDNDVVITKVIQPPKTL
jgi:hypothetical protein